MSLAKTKAVGAARTNGSTIFEEKKRVGHGGRMVPGGLRIPAGCGLACQASPGSVWDQAG